MSCDYHMTPCIATTHHQRATDPVLTPVKLGHIIFLFNTQRGEEGKDTTSELHTSFVGRFSDVIWQYFNLTKYQFATVICDLLH